MVSVFRVSVAVVGALASLAAIAGLDEIESAVRAAQQRHYLELVAGSAAATEAKGSVDAGDCFERYAPLCLPAELRPASDRVDSPVAGHDAVISSRRYSSGDGSTHSFSVWATANYQKPLCWIAEGYAPLVGAKLVDAQALLTRTVLAAVSEASYQLLAVPRIVDR